MTPPRDAEAASVPAQEELELPKFGSSVYGGRPTFALRREDGASGGSLALYELLPDEQARVRKERLERANRQLAVTSFEEVFADSDAAEVERWAWEEWSAAKVARLSGSRVRSVESVVRATLEDASVEESAVLGSGAGEVFLSETPGVRLALAFTGLKPVRRVDRMRALVRGVAGMSDEECYYWYAKCRSPSSPNGEKALRTLLTDHI